MKNLLFAVFVSVCWDQAESNAQNITIEPDKLSEIPVGQTDRQKFWQQLKVRLSTVHPASDKSIVIVLPNGLNLLDVDNDGQFRDEVRVSYEVAGFDDPKIFVSDHTSSDTISLGSVGNIDENSEIYIQFPVYAVLDTPSGVGVYRVVLVVDESEIGFAESPEVRFVDISQGGSSWATEPIVQFSNIFATGVDTTLLSDGRPFPQEPMPLVQFLPDLVVDRGVTSTSNTLSDGDKNDDNDTEYTFFWAESPDLIRIDTLGLKPALTSTGERYVASEGYSKGIQLDLSELDEGNYFLYAISNLTGDLTLGRSRRFQVIRPPQINSVGPLEDVTFDSGGLYNAQGVPDGKGQRRLRIEFEINDVEDDLGIYLFASQDSTLTTAANSFNAEGLPELANAELLNKAGPIGLTDIFFWEFTDGDIIAEGDYFIYALVSDGRSIVLGRSIGRVQIIHSPFLRFDALTDGRGGRVDTIITGGINPQRYLTFTWGRKGFSGDSDLDNNALIDLYYSSEPAGKDIGFELPKTGELFTALLQNKAWVIAGGIEEDGDSREQNQFVWDLWSLASEESLTLLADDPYYFYGLISDGNYRRLVQINGGQENDRSSKVVFDHQPTLKPLQPVETIKIGPGQTGRIAWDAIDIDDDARVRVLLVSSEFGSEAKYSELIEDVVYVVNSFDGYSSSEIDFTYDLSENESEDYLDFSIDHFRRGINNDEPPPSGNYSVFIAITDQNEFTEAWCWKAPGQIVIENQSVENIADLPISLRPERFTMGNEGKRQTFELRVTLDQPIDLIKTSILFDNAAFSPVDQNTDLEGVQPFSLSSDFSPAKLLKNNVSLAEDDSGQSLLTLEYLEPAKGEISGINEGSVFVYFEMEALLYSGPTSLKLKVGDVGQPLSVFGLDGKEIGLLSDVTLSEGKLISDRGTLNGAIRMEGRDNMQTEATIQLRSNGSYLAVTDSIFEIANDVNLDQNGIQIQVESGGEFALTNVPTGLWDLHLLIAGYLPGISRNISLNAGQVINGLKPESDPDENTGYILGGDVVGYESENGDLLPDNEITLADWDYIASYFGLNTIDGDSIQTADITGDGKIDIVDLSIVGSNFSKRGMDPVYKSVVDKQTVSFQYVTEKKLISAGEIYVIPITMVRSKSLIGYQFEFQWSETDWDWVDVSSFEGDMGWSARRKTSRGSLWGSSGIGGKYVPSAIDWKLRARVDNPELPVIRNALVVDNRKNALKATIENRSNDLIVRDFQLNVNYPNPFNPSTHIPFNIDLDGNISLVVYDVLGRPVREIYSGWIQAGWHEMIWDGLDDNRREAASGVYVCRLEGKKESQNISMVLLR